ncbi:MAG: class I SAM-dependent methyltransferase [Anaerolineae bacterium]|nr:class I SAM-dependent methyltransferase [Anaerolineae bacterium]
MQAYNPSFARIYNQRWTGFAQRVAPQIWTFYESTPAAEHRSLLDLCCGTGQLALAFLERDYHVVGIDLSEHMLLYARENAGSYLATGQARFIHADASDFGLDERFGLVVSTFDALNHLPSADALRNCFRCVYPVLLPGGFYVFDLNTRAGLRARWNGVQVENTEEILLVTRGIYDEESEKAWTGITGFLRTESGLYERFEQVAYNIGFDLAWVRSALLETGWRSVYFARMEDLGMPIAEPERENRVFIVAYK